MIQAGFHEEPGAPSILGFTHGLNGLRLGLPRLGKCRFVVLSRTTGLSVADVRKRRVACLSLRAPTSATIKMGHHT